MTRVKRFSVLLMLGSTLNLLFPAAGSFRSAQAQTPVIPAVQRNVVATTPIDVALDANNKLHGKLVSAEGIALSGANIQLFRANELISAAKTNQQGVFQTDSIAGGVCELVTAHQTVNLRVWTQRAAPPNARQRLLVAETNVVRGQCSNPGCEIINCDGSCGGGHRGAFGMMFHPLVLGAAIAAAIAIPLALDDDDDPPPAS